ncbi:Crp/Fnr family transcriptional regulator [Candidatus Nitrospira bockiana]
MVPHPETETHPNRLVAALPEPLHSRLLGKMDLVNLAERQVLYEPEEPMEYAYFPCSAIISLLTIMQDGASVEVATVGSEGFLGLPLYFGMESAFARGIVHIPGEARRMRSTVFQEEIEQSPPLAEAVRRYAQTLLVQITRTAACNRLHTLEQRGARWLLATHDRIDQDEFPVTHEFAAEVLGVTRPSAGLMLQSLEKAGLIRASRGRICILDRTGLEAVACECYEVLRKEFSRPLS